MTSIGQRLEQYRGLGPGFDFLRVALATLIVAAHCMPEVGATAYMDTPFWFVDYALVPMFFSLSGFLITGSAQRLSLKNFIINRAMRIVPALAVDVLFCSLIVGPLVTSFALAAYFRDPAFWSYALNIVGYIHYHLPGVFLSNPDSRVNGALWTVPWEIGCYVVMAGLMISKAVKKPSVVAALVLAYILIGAILHIAYGKPRTMGIPKIAEYLTNDRGAQALAAFLFGILAYQMRFAIPYRGALALACVLACVAASVLLGRADLFVAWNRILLLPCLAYVTVFLGLTRLPLPRYFHRGDYSYGIYLYHLPLLQIIMLLFPDIARLGTAGGALLFVIGIPFVVLFATGSWHFIEKPILALRKRFSFVARVRGVADPATNA